MTENLDKIHVLIASIFSFVAGVGAAYLRLHLLFNEVKAMHSELSALYANPHKPDEELTPGEWRRKYGPSKEN